MFRLLTEKIIYCVCFSGSGVSILRRCVFVCMQQANERQAVALRNDGYLHGAPQTDGS